MEWVRIAGTGHTWIKLIFFRWLNEIPDKSPQDFRCHHLRRL
jgi:hypothetical protein